MFITLLKIIKILMYMLYVLVGDTSSSVAVVDFPPDISNVPTTTPPSSSCKFHAKIQTQ